MNILIMSNTYKPIVGGLEKSVEVLMTELRKRGHHVLLVTPQIEGTPEEAGVIRLPAIQHFNKTDFAVELPISSGLSAKLEKFSPDIVHSQHPFLIGDTALRVSSKFSIPIVFTYHTAYEQYTHYVPVNDVMMKKFVIELAKGYCDLCDHIIAPSQSIANVIQSRGVKTPVSVIPTGIDVDNYQCQRSRDFRESRHIPKSAFLLGTAGRMNREKNIGFLAKAVSSFLKKNEQAYFVMMGDGPLREETRNFIASQGLSERVILTGTLTGDEFISAYQALDVFVFASHSETQGLVLVEAMAAGIPVVAVDAPGVREVVKDRINGRLIPSDDEEGLIEALEWTALVSGEKRQDLKNQARETAKDFSVEQHVEKILQLYSDLLMGEKKVCNLNDNLWKRSSRLIKTQKDIVLNISKATGEAFHEFPKQVAENARDKAKEKKINKRKSD